MKIRIPFVGVQNLATGDSPTSSYVFESTPSSTRQRIASVDFLRGLVMIIMALDHIRGYLHFDSLTFDPTDLHRTTPALFITRLITHLCAPAFIFLAGTSAYFIAQRKSIQETSFFLITRGIWLIVLQFTLIRFVWNFDPAFHYNSSTIISTIGFSMITLALLIRFPLKTVFVIGLIMVAGHNMLDGVSFAAGSPAAVVWSFLHEKKLYHLANNYSFQFMYPLIPWAGVMALGYCTGILYSGGFLPKKRKQILLRVGAACLLVFIALRWLNVYGDPKPWLHHATAGLTTMSFLNVEKYPPSLLFLCLTLGVSFLLLGIFDNRDLTRWEPVTVFGKVPMFYYVVHILAIHLLALGAVTFLGFPLESMVFIGSSNHASPLLAGKFGFSLVQIYIIWASLIVFLYQFCSYWSSFKTRNRDKWWISYL